MSNIQEQNLYYQNIVGNFEVLIQQVFKRQIFLNQNFHDQIPAQ